MILPSCSDCCRVTLATDGMNTGHDEYSATPANQHGFADSTLQIQTPLSSQKWQKVRLAAQPQPPRKSANAITWMLKAASFRSVRPSCRIRSRIHNQHILSFKKIFLLKIIENVEDILRKTNRVNMCRGICAPTRRTSRQHYSSTRKCSNPAGYYVAVRLSEISVWNFKPLEELKQGLYRKNAPRVNMIADGIDSTVWTINNESSSADTWCIIRKHCMLGHKGKHLHQLGDSKNLYR